MAKAPKSPPLDPSNVKMGRRVSYWRHRLDLTIVQLAEKLDISKSTVSRIERGEQALKPKQLDMLLELFGVPIGRFYRSGDDEATKGREVAA